MQLASRVPPPPGMGHQAVARRLCPSHGPRRAGSAHTAQVGQDAPRIDLAVPIGTTVRAAAAGKVIFSGTQSGYGRLVIIDHGNGITTRYGHNSKLLVSVGQWVEAGERIALSGNTGNSTGPHLHFEIRINGSSVDPLKYLK